eukprot:9487552-Ditylum_brightwellii.AAC.2
MDSILTGCCFNTIRSVEEFNMSKSAYADDAVFLFNPRDKAETETPHIMQHCYDWGMKAHHGLLATGTEKEQSSKTELLFVAKLPHSYTTINTLDEANFSPITMDNGKCIPVVHKFCYLGSMITTDLRGQADVDNHIKKASKAFGALRHSIFSSKSVSFATKKATYTGLALAILFHGAET